MRVISQDGTMDVPYENVVLYQDEKEIMCIFSGVYIGRKLARYSTTEKTEKAMEMLREAYVGMPIVMQNVDISDDVAKEFERLKKCGIMVRTENQPSKVDFINNAVFQFPQDDEIEV